MSTNCACNHERILIALDGSEPSDWAAEVGRRFVEQLGGRVRLLHVVEPTIPVYEDFAADKEIQERRIQYGDGILTRALRLFAPALMVDTVIRCGLPCEEITAEAREWKATLIVVGTHGRNRLAQLVLGSTSEAVLKHSPCAVIVVGHRPRWTPLEATKEIAAGTSHGAAVEPVHSTQLHAVRTCPSR